MRQPRLAGLRDHHGTVVGPAGWPAIIDRETHERLVALIDGYRRGPRTAPVRKRLLTGFLRCGVCGARMIAAPNERGVGRYTCPARGSGGASCVTVVANRAEDTVRDLVLRYLDTRDFARALARARRVATDADRSVVQTVDQLTRDRARLTELGDMLADGEITRAEYARLTSRVETRIEQAETRVARVDQAAPAAELKGQGAQLARAWENMTLEERRAVIGAIAEHFTVRAAGEPRNVFRPDRIVPAWRF